MPLIFAAWLAFAAGLLLGFGGAFISGAVAAAALLAGAAARRDGRGLAAGLLLVAGMLLADAVDRDDRACAARIAGSESWTAILDDGASPGAYITGTIESGSCRVRASFSVSRGVATAGARVRVRGRPVPAGSGLMVQHAVLEPAGGRAWLARWRARAAAAIDSAFGADAPMVRALLVADSRAVPPEIRDRFAAAGIVHMLSISGLHVSVIALSLQLVFEAMRLSRRAASIATLGATALYIAVIGAPASAVRAGTMLGILALSRLLQRPTSPWAALAAGAFAPLFDPRAVLRLGYQLSVVGIAGLIASRSLTRRWLAPRLSGWRLRLSRDLGTTVVASLVSLPLVAWTFGRVSLIAPVANLAAGPVIAVLQPMLFLALLCAPSLTAARFVAAAAHPLLLLFDGIARTAADIPFAWFTVAPSLPVAIVCAAASAAFVLACVSRFPGRAAVTCAGALALAAWIPLAAARGSGELEIHLIDVGQGDAIAVRTPHGEWVLCDAGRTWRGGDAGRATVIPYLRRYGGVLDAFVLSHPHADHVGGAASIIRALHPRDFYDAAFAAGSGVYRDALEAADAAGTAWHRVHPHDTLRVDGVTFAFLAPDSGWTASLDDPNLASTIMKVSYGATAALLVGDAEAPEERWLLAHAAGELHADVLKVGHHGSRTSSTDPFLDAVDPRVALVSVGLGNDYGHPSPSVIADLGARGVTVLRTDLLGTVIVRSDGARLTVETAAGRWAVADSGAAPGP